SRCGLHDVRHQMARRHLGNSRGSRELRWADRRDRRRPPGYQQCRAGHHRGTRHRVRARGGRGNAQGGSPWDPGVGQTCQGGCGRCVPLGGRKNRRGVGRRRPSCLRLRGWRVHPALARPKVVARTNDWFPLDMATDPLTGPLVRERAVRERSRWLALAGIGVGFATVVTALTAINVALPSAQLAMHFTTVDRQWVITAYTLAFGSLLLAGGRLVNLLGQKVTFLAGLLGFALASAVGGASVNFGMLVAARACQGAFAALLVPSALSLLTTTFTDPRERARAFGIFGAIATAGGAVGLLVGGALTEYLSWRWTLYVNVILAGVAFVGGALVLGRQPAPTRPRLDIPGVLLSSVGMFSL